MNNRTFFKIIILFLIILFFILLCFSIIMVNKLKNDNRQIATINDERPQTVKEVIENSESEYIKEEDNKIYVKFAKKLYDSTTKSNESYFNNLISEIEMFFSKKEFYLIDDEQKINIYVKYEDNNYKTIINGIEDYFNKGTKFQEIKYPEFQLIYTPNEYLKLLLSANMSPRLISKSLGEGQKLENNYTSYLDGEILIRKTGINTVRNIIFTYKYKDDVVKNVKVKTSLKEIQNIYPDNSYGSVNEGYLGYYTDEYYYFFYDDEISVYPISYYENDKFEKLLVEYLEDKNLDKFINSIMGTLRDYDYLEYDFETGKAHIMFSHKGYEIDIDSSNPNGIILYSNYYLTDITRELILDEKITFKSKENAVDKIENERRRNR